MQDENNNQPVILNLNPVNDSISQFIQLQTGILSEQEMFVPLDSILPIGTRVKIEYRLKSFGQKENVKIIDAVCEVVGPEVDSEKGRRGVRVKFLKLSPTSQVLIQKLLEKIKATKPTSGEKKIVEQKTEMSKAEEPKVKIEEPKVSIEEPKVSISEPKVEIVEPNVQISEPSEKTTIQEQAIPSFNEVMAKIESEQKKEELKVQIEQKPSTLAEIMSKEIEKPKSGEIKTTDDKQAQYIFEYLPPGQPIEENTGIVKLREVVRSTDISSVKRTSKIWTVLILILLIIAGVVGFFFVFPQYVPKIFVKSHEVSKVITKQDLTPEIQPQPIPTPTPTPVPVEEKKEVKEVEKLAEKKEEKEKEASAKEEKVQEPEIQPLTVKEETKGEGVKIITSSKIKKEREKEKKVQEEKEKKISQEKEEKAEVKEKVEAEKAKAKKEAQSAEPGKIIIQVTPTDADLTVFIDGSQAGTMPTITKQLPAGIHTIKVTAEGYNDEVRKVEISEGETKTIKINLKEKQ